VNPLVQPALRPVIAHRGASAEAPENTMAAFELAVRRGADAIELDVRLTADGMPVVIHDATLDRTTDRRGAVASRTLDALQAADGGARFTRDGGRTFPWRGRGVRVPALAEVLEVLPGTPLLIEIKDPAAQTAVRKVIAERGAEGRCVVAATLARALDAFRTQPFLLGASRRDIARLWIAATLGLPTSQVAYRLLAVPLRHRGLVVPTERFLAAAARLACPVHVWTVNDPGVAITLWRRGVSGILTDAPAVMLSARASLQPDDLPSFPT
jgi:glycerophosphoryl diester phosphodiesterase